MATIYGGYAKSNGKNFIKVYLTYSTSTASYNTSTTVTWTAGCHIDSGYNTNAKITVSCGGKSSTVDNKGWGSGNHSMVSGTTTWKGGTSAASKTITAKLTLGNGNTSTITATINVPALTSWNVTYNANGGTGVPATQKKYYNITLTLSSTKPTKSGYTFVGWNTSSSATSSNHNPGSTYGTNATLSLYAIWKKTITITYNANGGSGAPASQSQTIYNSTTSARFTIPSTRPTKTKYNFLGWATSATATSASYNPSTAYNFSNSTTLYAVWKLAYISPQITNSSIRAIRTATNSASDTEEVDNGEYIYLSFAWTAGSIDGGTTTQAPQCKITATANGSSIVEYGPAQLTQTPFTYKFSTAYSADTPVSLQIELYDTGYETYKLLKTVTVATAIYPQDLIVNNKNVYMGVMHPAVQEQLLTLPTTYVDGQLHFNNNTKAYISVSSYNNTNNMYYQTDGYHGFYTSDTANTAPAGTAYIKNNGIDLIRGDYRRNGNPYIITETKTWDNLSVNGGATTQFTEPIGKTGYTPIGIAGFDIDNAGTNGVNMQYVWFSACRVSGSNVLLQMHNSGSNKAVIKLYATILYKAD